MNYVDANILIYAAVDATQKGIACRELLGEEKLATSTLSLDEVAYKLKKHSLETAVKTIELLSKAPNITLVPFLAEDVNEFRELLIGGLAPRGSIHALTAKKVKCPIFYSEDPDFDNIREFVRKTPW